MKWLVLMLGAGVALGLALAPEPKPARPGPVTEFRLTQAAACRSCLNVYYVESATNVAGPWELAFIYQGAGQWAALDCRMSLDPTEPLRAYRVSRFYTTP